jgi:hypothetical protein
VVLTFLKLSILLSFAALARARTLLELFWM